MLPEDSGTSHGLGEFRFTPPNKAWIKVFGRVSKEQSERLLGQAADRATELPYLLVTVDIADMDSATPESRRVAAQVIRRMPPRAMAFVGGTFAQRVIAKIVLKATEALDGGRTAFAFVADDDAADAWLQSKAEQFEATGRFT